MDSLTLKIIMKLNFGTTNMGSTIGKSDARHIKRICR